ncbi:hypothetical protein ABT144_35095 [Streptomyces sp. NPDC002039]|uniref:hypothetical protein n=1 Tax=Streptomyces sp. NPDC002039 TaxID=3154660 RepID=UPI00333386A9
MNDEPRTTDQALASGFERSTDPARLDAALIHRRLSGDSHRALGRSREKQDAAIAGSLNLGLCDSAFGHAARPRPRRHRPGSQ